MQSVPPHVAVNQENLAVFMSRQAQRQVRRNEALSFLRHTTAHHDRFKWADIPKFIDSRPQTTELLHRRPTIQQRGELLQRWSPRPSHDHTQIERILDWLPQSNLGIN